MDLVLRLGDREFVPRLTFGTLRRLEQALGVDPTSEEFTEKLGPSELAAIVWALVAHRGPGGDPSLTVADVEDLLELSQETIQRVTQVIETLYERAGLRGSRAETPFGTSSASPPPSALSEASATPTP